MKGKDSSHYAQFKNSMGYSNHSGNSGKRYVTHLRIRDKSNRRNISNKKNRKIVNYRMMSQGHANDLEQDEQVKNTEFIPLINDKTGKGTAFAKQNVLATSQRVKKKRKVGNSQYHNDKTFSMAWNRNVSSIKKVYFK